MNSRDILTTDLPVLQAAIDGDKFHPGEWHVEMPSEASDTVDSLFGQHRRMPECVTEHQMADP